MGLTSSSCMSSHGASSPILIKNRKNKKTRIDLFLKSHPLPDNESKTNNQGSYGDSKGKHHVVDKLHTTKSSLRIDTSQDDDFEKVNFSENCLSSLSSINIHGY